MNEGAPVAVVTGASRGAGRGIAIALGAHGFTVFVTGRTEQAGDSSLAGTIHETVEAIAAAGGKGIAVRVDHRNDEEVRDLFDRVRQDEGRLDILVNNAALIHDELMSPASFWEKPLAAGVDLLDVGLRSGYVASYYAAPMLVERRRGLVVFTSASGAVHYVYGPAYGAHKAGMDKFAADMAVDFKEFGVAALSIWMGGRAHRTDGVAHRRRSGEVPTFGRDARDAGADRPRHLGAAQRSGADGAERPDGYRC